MPKPNNNGRQSQLPVPKTVVQGANGEEGAVGTDTGAGEERASLSREELTALRELTHRNGEGDRATEKEQDIIYSQREILDRAKADLDRFKHEMQQQIMTMVAQALPTPPRRNWSNNFTHQNPEQGEQRFMNDERNRNSLGSNYFQNRVNHMTLEDNYMVSRKPQIHEWGIIFDGEDSSVTVEDFVFRVEHLQRYHGRSWNEIVGQFHKLLKGRAAKWYWTQIKMHHIPDWPTLRNALFRNFSSHLSNFDLERQLMERRQRANEPIDDYIHEMNNLRSRLRRALPEFDIIEILKRNVIEIVGKILYPMVIKSVEQFRAEYHTVQNTFNTKPVVKNQPSNYFNRNHYQVNEVYPYEDAPQSDETVPFAVQQAAPFVPPTEQAYPAVAEVPPPMARSLICWNCKMAGHTYFDCEHPRTIFCYKCGLPDTITPKCVRCQGNIRRNPFQARTTSSDQNRPNQ